MGAGNSKGHHFGSLNCTLVVKHEVMRIAYINFLRNGRPTYYRRIFFLANRPMVCISTYWDKVYIILSEKKWTELNIIIRLKSNRQTSFKFPNKLIFTKRETSLNQHKISFHLDIRSEKSAESWIPLSKLDPTYIRPSPSIQEKAVAETAWMCPKSISDAFKETEQWVFRDNQKIV